MITTLTALILSAAPAFELDWEAPASCSDRPDTVSLVGEATGHAEVQLKERDSQWLVTVIFFAPMEGIRRVTVPTCDDAVRTAGLLVQLGSRGGFQPKPVPAVIIEPKPQTPDAAAPAVAAPTPWRFSVGLGGALDLGTLPAPEPRIAASFLASREVLGLAADLRFGFAQPVGAVRVLHLAELQGAACLLPMFGPVRIGPCASLSVGSWRLSTYPGLAKGLVVASSGLQVRAGLALTERLEAVLVAGVRANLVRPSLVEAARTALSPQTLFTTPTLAADLQLTVGWRW